MNRRSVLASLVLIPTLGLTFFSLPVSAGITLENGLTFFSDGTQIIKNDHTTMIKFNDGSISDNKNTIGKYLNSPSNITRVLKSSENSVVDFNKLIIARENTGFNGYDGTEVTIVYSNTGNPLESYDSKGEIKKFLYDEKGSIAQTESSTNGLITIDYSH